MFSGVTYTLEYSRQKVSQHLALLFPKLSKFESTEDNQGPYKNYKKTYKQERNTKLVGVFQRNWLNQWLSNIFHCDTL